MTIKMKMMAQAMQNKYLNMSSEQLVLGVIVCEVVIDLSVVRPARVDLLPPTGPLVEIQ